MCHIICRRSTGITGKSRYLVVVVVSTAKVVHLVDRYGDGSRSAHTQDEMDIYEHMSMSI